MRYASLCLLGLLVVAPATAQVSDSDAQNVTIDAPALVSIAVGADVTINLAAPNPGAPLEGTTTSTYAITTNMATNKISAYITGAAGYSSGVQLFSQLAAPGTGGASVGERELLAGSGNAVDLVTGIPPTQEGGLVINYRATAPATTPDSYNETREVTYTITGS